jgi:hypothetical protein
MCRVTNRGPGGSGGFDAVLRAAVVVALLAGAGLALRARQGLDWDALADPVQVRWARVLLGLVLLALVVSLARRLLQRLRRPRRRQVPAGRAEPEGEPFPFLLRVLAVALVVLALGLVWFVIDAVSGPVPVDELTGDRPDDVPVDGPDPSRRSTSWPVLAAVAAVLVAAVAGARLVAARRDEGLDLDAPPPEDASARDLSAAVRAAESELGVHADARAAVVAAYTAMAASIAAGLRRRGGVPRASDTPTELLERAAAAGLVHGDPAATLTVLFREARFSRHPMGEPERRAAVRALEAVRDELAARRA